MSHHADHNSAGDVLRRASLIVVKIGSSLLAEGDRLRTRWMGGLASDIKAMCQRGQSVILVSSGAIAAGRGVLRLKGALKLEESQGAAAAGQILLAYRWRERLEKHGLVAAQLLLTLGDTEDRRRYLNARSCLRALLDLGAVPIINENDTVATSEIRYGDNDRLAARIADMAGADCLVLLSQVDGLYSRDPSLGAGKHIPYIAAINEEIEAMAGGAGDELSRGGMKTKLEAAKIATRAGCAMIIASGQSPHVLSKLEKGQAKCSLFAAGKNPAAARKRWIASALETKGRLWIDAGAVRAMAGGRSLLPAGVVKVEGGFSRGDAVWICDGEGNNIAVGLVAYAAGDAVKIIGRRSSETEAILGWRGRDEMIHRDDLALLAQLDNSKGRKNG